MHLTIEAAMLFLSLLILIKMSHWVIDSAIKIAKFARLSELVVGFLFIAVATSLPELAVSISSLLSGHVELSIGNLLGSNVADLALIVGIAALFGPVIIRRSMLRDISTVLFLTSFVLVLLLGMTFASRFVGVLLLGVFCAFVYFSIKRKMRIPLGRLTLPKRDHKLEARALIRTIIIFLVGVLGVFASSKLVVESASNIALILGISKSVIGATIVAIGTSLPELAVDLTAIRAKRWGLALGDALGSALTNLTLVFGFVLMVSPFAININIFETLLLFVLLTNIFLWYFITRGKLERTHGLVLLFLYQIFIMSIFGVQFVIL